MGMLIRRHRDRHSADATPAPKRRKRKSADVPAQVDPPKAPDAEVDKAPDTEADPGAGGERVSKGSKDAKSE